MDCRSLLDAYLKWIKDNTLVESIEEGKSCKMTTPFMDRHNDHIEFYIVKDGAGKLMLTDDGYIIHDLQMSGMEFNTTKRKKLLNDTLRGFGIKQGNEGELMVEATPENFGQKKHYLLQAMMAVNDLFALSQESIQSFFKEDVELYFRSRELVFTKDVLVVGKTGYNQNIDFLISKSKSHPERFIKTITRPQKQNVTSALFALTDASEARDEKPDSYIFYNDQEEKASADVLNAMKNYGVTPFPWSERNKHVKELMVD